MVLRRVSELTLDLGLDDPDDAEAISEAAARALGCAPEELPPLQVKKRGLDARHGRVRLLLVVGEVDGPVGLGGDEPREVSAVHDVLIVGDGPAGLFAAYELARHGVGVTVLDRGKEVQPRRRDLKGLTRHGHVDPDSNYCFGEGGAGTYSDGKLYTRAHKRGNVRDVLEVLALHGAPSAILTDARPHIGSNRLPKVVTALRERLASVGVGFRFGCRVTGLLCEGHGASRRVAGVRLADGSEIAARAVVMATGHSARDVFELLREADVTLVAKPFALGVRIEHPQPLINAIQYGASAGHPKLPAAAYRLACQARQRGVFSFCMCPGGFMVPASTEPGELVVNGMSLSKRDSPFANSGLVVEQTLEDLARAGLTSEFAGVELQRRVERAAWQAGGGKLVAPATRVTDFLARKGSSTLPRSSYVPGLAAADVGEVLAVLGLGVEERLREALKAFGRTLRGYITDEAVLVATESRTSSPVRVERDAESLQAPRLAGLFPAGEGAGYAGGIVSAAVDGVRVARAIVQARLGDSSTMRVISAGAPSRIGGPQ